MADSKILEIQSLFERAQEEKKVVVLAFLGGDLCPWSEKMRQEVLSSSEFIEGVKKMGYFFPLSVNLEKQKGALQKIFYVEETPTVVLFDYSQEEIARLSFLSMSPSEYVARFQELIQDFESVVAFIQKPEEKISEKGMIDLYERSKKLSSKCYKKEILQIGLKKEKGSFFALERYADLLSSSKPKSSEVAKLKKELLAKDSDGSQGIRLKVAILEFQRLAVRIKGKNRLHKVVRPLINYLQKEGCSDLENRWKIELMIAQFFLSRNEKKQALDHALLSWQAAPDETKDQVQGFLDYLNPPKSS